MAKTNGRKRAPLHLTPKGELVAAMLEAERSICEAFAKFQHERQSDEPEVDVYTRRAMTTIRLLANEIANIPTT